MINEDGNTFIFNIGLTENSLKLAGIGFVYKRHTKEISFDIFYLFAFEGN